MEIYIYIYIYIGENKQNTIEVRWKQHKNTIKKCVKDNIINRGFIWRKEII